MMFSVFSVSLTILRRREQIGFYSVYVHTTIAVLGTVLYVLVQGLY